MGKKGGCAKTADAGAYYYNITFYLFHLFNFQPAKAFTFVLF
jgi:hypothetical protein